jgi:phosphatidylinositol glycan class N
MVIIGLAYLIFEKRLLARSALKGETSPAADNALSRILIGVQVYTVPLWHIPS